MKDQDKRLKEFIDSGEFDRYYTINVAQGTVTNNRTNKVIGTKNNKGYLIARLKGLAGSYLLHRIIFLYHHGYLTPGLQIDHIDGCKTNNGLNNLQELSQLQNAQKRASDRIGKGLKYPYIHKTGKGKFKVDIHLKAYKNEIAAAYMASHMAELLNMPPPRSKRKNASSQYRYVHKAKNRWVVCLPLGAYDTEAEAAKRVKEAYPIVKGKAAWAKVAHVFDGV